MATSEFVETLRALQSNDNNARSVAEKRFSDAKSQQPGTTVAALFQVLAQQQLEEPVREQAAVLLRQCLGKLREEDSTWAKLGQQAQGECKVQLMQLFQGESQAKVRKKMADCVQSLGNQLIDIEASARPQNVPEWPELMSTLLKVVLDGSGDAGLRADALWTVKELLTSIWQVMVANKEQTVIVLKTCLSDASAAVQANATCLFCELIDSLEAKEDRAAFGPLLGDLCGALQRVADGGESTLLNTALQSMEGTTNSVEFFKDAVTSHLLPFLKTIATSYKAEDTRRLALEVLVSFAESKPKAMSKIPHYIEQTLEISVGFLMNLNDDVTSWAEADEDEDDEDNFTNGKEVVDRLSRCMHKAEKFPLVLETLKPVLSAFLQSADWKQVVAGITVISQIAEYVDEEVLVTQMLAGIKGQLQSSNARVRHACWSAIAQLAEDHEDFVTTEPLAQQLLPEFLAGINDPCLRVSSRCMEAFQLYGQEVEREILEPFVPSMMESLGQKLQVKNLSVQRQAVTFIAVLAGQVEDGFAPYYGQLMPVLKQLISAILHRTEERTLLGKAFECVSMLAKAVGPAGFRADAEVIMQAMTQATQLPDLPANDPVKEYMLQAAQRICWTMKADFLPFVPHILPGILEKFTLAPKELDDETRKNLGDDEEVNLALVSGQDGKFKVMVMSTSAMEDLQNALECVHTFVEELGELYSPFVAQTAQALLPVFEFSMEESIRDLAFETWGELCQAARKSGQAQVLSQLVLEFLGRILPKLEQSSKDDSGNLDLGALKTMADGVAACIKKAGKGILSAEYVKHITQVALNAMAASFKRREESKTTGQPVRLEEEEEADDEDEEADESAVQTACCEVIGALMQNDADIFVAEVLQLCLPVVEKLIQPTVAEVDRKLAIFLVCDMLEHLEQRATAHWNQFLPHLLRDLLNPSPEIRQPACYGVSLAARNPAFAPIAEESAKTLVKVITESRGRAKRKSEKSAQACADNAISALMEILLNHKASVAANEAQLWGIWLQSLPCQEDEAEGKKNHATLLQMVQAEKPEVVGEAGANLPQVFSILVDIYKTDMATDDTSKGIGQLVLQVGTARLEQMAGQLKEKQRKKLMRIHREAGQGA